MAKRFHSLRDGTFGLIVVLFIIFEPDGLAARFQQLDSQFELLDTETRESVVTVGGYWQPKYSVPNQAMVEAVQMVARTESLLLDPVYTGKAMAGLMGGRVKRGERRAANMSARWIRRAMRCAGPATARRSGVRRSGACPDQW